MKTRILLAFVIFAVAFPNKGFAQQNSVTFSNNLSEYRIIQYASVKGYSPKSIMNLDNNGELLIACRKGKTVNQLNETGLSILKSQLRLLELYNLISVNDQIVQTTVPILGTAEIKRIREISKNAGAVLLKVIQPDIERLLDILKTLRRERNTYSILFAYILDGIIWSDFESEKLVHPIEINVDNPFWSGEVWAYYPKRDFSCGTNNHVAGSSTFIVNWSQTANKFLRQFYEELSNYNDQFRRSVDKGYMDDPEILNAFAPFRIFDKDGHLTIPVIEANDDNELYQISRKISKKVAERIPSLISLKSITEEFAFRDIQQALVITYHEIMWDLMDEIENQGLISKPVAFTDPENARQEHLSDLMIVVKNKD